MTKKLGQTSRRTNKFRDELIYFSYVAAASATIHDFLKFLFTSIPHNILSKPLAGFPYNHHQSNGQQ